jgi:hypothetical protein
MGGESLAALNLRLWSYKTFSGARENLLLELHQLIQIFEVGLDELKLQAPKAPKMGMDKMNLFKTAASIEIKLKHIIYLMYQLMPI